MSVMKFTIDELIFVNVPNIWNKEDYVIVKSLDKGWTVAHISQVNGKYKKERLI